MTAPDNDDMPTVGPQLTTERPLAARIRFHQSWYRLFVLGQIGFGTTRPPHERALGSILTTQAAEAGLNFTSQAARELYIARRADGWGVDPVRCTSYLTSSQALSLNLLGPLVVDLEWSADIFRSVTGRIDITRIRAIDIEVSARRLGLDLGDKTHIDALVQAETETGLLNIALEIKLGDRFNSRQIPIRDRAEYHALNALWKDPHTTLSTPSLNQLVRCHSIAAALALKTDASIGEAAFLLLVHFPGDNEAESIANLYSDSLTTDSFRALSLDRFLGYMATTATNANNVSVVEALAPRYLALEQSEQSWAHYLIRRRERNG